MRPEHEPPRGLNVLTDRLSVVDLDLVFKVQTVTRTFFANRNVSRTIQTASANKIQDQIASWERARPTLDEVSPTHCMRLLISGPLKRTPSPLPSPPQPNHKTAVNTMKGRAIAKNTSIVVMTTIYSQPLSPPRSPEQRTLEMSFHTTTPTPTLHMKRDRV